MMSISRAITWLAEQAPDAVSVRGDDRTLTRAELDAESNRLARAYAELGVGQDDLVTVGLPNGAGFFLACAAIWKLGATPQPISSRLPLPERQAIVELADSRLVLGADPADHPGRACLPASFAAPPELAADQLPDASARSWKAPTSGGTTGRPKIIMAGTPAVADPTGASVFYIPDHAVQLVPGPLYHNGPFIYASRGMLAGHELVVLPRFDAERALASIERYGVTWVLMVPTMMQRIWRLPTEVREGYDLSSLQTVFHLGAPCPPWLKRAWIDWLGPDRIMELYAGTEAQGITLINGREWLEHPGSVGRPAPGFEFRVLSDAGDDLPAGEVGEVYMRPKAGPGTTYRYVGASARSVAGGWESLGDLGRMDADGYLYLTDRSADLVLSGGANVYPAEVEAVLDAHPAVRSSAVFGLPDDDLGERVHAVVDVADATVEPAELLAWVGERLARYKVPRGLEVVHSPLRDDAGKMRRGALRAARLPG